MDNFFIGQTMQLDDAVYTIVSRQPNKVVTLENSKGERFSKTVDSLRKRVERGTTTPFSPKVNDTIYIECVGLCRIKSEIDNKKVLTTSYGVDFIISKGSFCNRKFVSLFEGKRMKTTDGDIIYMEGVGLSECLSDNGNWGKLMKRIEDDTVYEVTRGEFTNKKVTKKHMLELCNIKVGKYKVAEGYYPCICKTCQMKDILTYEEMLEHWRDCKE